MELVAFTDGLISEIANALASVPPERGGALLAAGALAHGFIEDLDGEYSASHWDISSRLTGRIQAAELAGDGKFCGTVHSHPSGVPDPSNADIRGTGEMLDANPEVERLLICIVTQAEPRPGDLPVGAFHRMSVHVARRGPGSTVRVRRGLPHSLPILSDLGAVGIAAGSAHSLSYLGRTMPSWWLGPEDDLFAAFDDTYPEHGPRFFRFASDDTPVRVRHAIPWSPEAPSVPQLAASVAAALGRAPEGMMDRTSPLVGDLTNARVLIAGLGSVGTRLLEQLVRAGTGEVWLIDADEIESPNLSRTWYTTAHLRRSKALASADLIGAINPACVVHVVESLINDVEELGEICAGVDLVIGATDDPAGQSHLCHHAYATGTRFLACALYKSASAGEIVLVDPVIGTPCWHCSIGGLPDQRGDKDYGTGQLVGEVALGPSISLVTDMASLLAIGLLADPGRAAASGVRELLKQNHTIGIVSSTPRWGILENLFESMQGHQFAPQSVWMRPTPNPDCPICGENPVPPIADAKSHLDEIIEQVRRDASSVACTTAPLIIPQPTPSMSAKGRRRSIRRRARAQQTHSHQSEGSEGDSGQGAQGSPSAEGVEKVRREEHSQRSVDQSERPAQALKRRQWWRRRRVTAET